VICRRDVQADVRERFVELLEAATYPVHDLKQHPFGQNDAEIEATLYATAVDGEELDRVMRRIEEQPGVVQAFWNPSSEE
jgi:putative Mg2+ transporter-C (MgtC) family protein